MMKECTNCHCLNPDHASRCENCKADLKNSPALSNEELRERELALIRAQEKKQRIRGFVFGIIYLGLLGALIARLILRPLDTTPLILLIVILITLSVAPMITWFCAKMRPQRFFETSFKVESSFASFFLGLQGLYGDLKPNNWFSAKYRIGLFIAFLLAFGTVSILLIASFCI